MPMRPITEDQVDWNVLFDTIEIDLPIETTDYPICLQLFDASNELIMERQFQQPPVLLKNTFTSGKYHYRVIRNDEPLFSSTITF
jgi:hypothetical protein